MRVNTSCIHNEDFIPSEAACTPCPDNLSAAQQPDVRTSRTTAGSLGEWLVSSGTLFIQLPFRKVFHFIPVIGDLSGNDTHQPAAAQTYQNQGKEADRLLNGQ